MNDGDYQVLVIKHQTGVRQGCARCRHVFRSGDYLIGISLKLNGVHHKYFLAERPMEHCGVQRNVVMCFAAKDQANAEAEKTKKQIEADNGINGLQVLSVLHHLDN